MEEVNRQVEKSSTDAKKGVERTRMYVNRTYKVKSSRMDKDGEE